MLDKHFVSYYEKLVTRLRKSSGSVDQAMSLAVGGSFDAIGQIEADLLRMYGLRDGMRLIDLGCGSGRAAVAISRAFNIEYHGTDIVQDLLDYAKAKTPRSYRYSLVRELHIPDRDASADMICAFSLFTHLLHEETYIYLEECVRVLKPGGRLVFSFLEFSMPSLWSVFEDTVREARGSTRTHLNVFIGRDAIKAWAEHLQLTIEDWQDSAQGPCIPLSRPVVTDSGEKIEGRGNLGQSVCVLRKP
jgi:ubiquinone/menaquinone biosynthesis C-methylase UbiE